MKESTRRTGRELHEWCGWIHATDLRRWNCHILLPRLMQGEPSLKFGKQSLKECIDILIVHSSLHICSARLARSPMCCWFAADGERSAFHESWSVNKSLTRSNKRSGTLIGAMGSVLSRITALCIADALEDRYHLSLGSTDSFAIGNDGMSIRSRDPRDNRRRMTRASPLRPSVSRRHPRRQAREWAIPAGAGRSESLWSDMDGQPPAAAHRTVQREPRSPVAVEPRAWGVRTGSSTSLFRRTSGACSAKAAAATTQNMRRHGEYRARSDRDLIGSRSVSFRSRWRRRSQRSIHRSLPVPIMEFVRSYEFLNQFLPGEKAFRQSTRPTL